MNSTWARCTTPFEFDLNADPLQDVDQSLAWKFKTELDRLSTDNKNLSEILRDMCKKYITLQVQMTKLIRNENINESNYNDDQYPSLKLRDFTKNNISKVLVRCDAYDTSLVVKDGYQWRKYGQKVTKDNPSPRAYFRCSFAPYCHVKKKVQRSVKDKSVLVVIYEGRHNHKCISETKLLVGSSHDMNFGSAPPSAYCRSSESTLTIDSTKTSVCSDAQKPNQEIELPMEFKQFLVKQITSSLLNDPTFNSALLEPMLERTHEYEI